LRCLNLIADFIGVELTKQAICQSVLWIQLGITSASLGVLVLVLQMRHLSAKQGK